jgi:tricorn protease
VRLLAAENTGIKPDIDVDMRPDLVAKGQDPQLDAAIKLLMEELKKLRPRQPRKEIPRVPPAGRVGA